MKGRRHLSLTARLTIGYTLSCFALIGLVTVYLYLSLVNAIAIRDKKFLTFRADAVRSLLKGADGEQAVRQRIEKEWPARTAEVFYVRLVDGQGKVVAQSVGGEPYLSRVPFPDPRGGPSDSEVLYPELVELDNRPFRPYLAYVGTPEKPHVLQFLLDRTDESALLTEYRTRLFSTLSLVLAVCGLICFHIARRGLKPIQVMAETAARINSTNLAERMLPAPMPAELENLAATFDAMLVRLEESFNQLQRFSADIAHELRTPINNISGELQVALGKDRPVPYYQEAIGSSLEEVARLSRIIDSLLFLARAENPKSHLAKEPIHLRTELEAALEFYGPAASEGGITCALDVPVDLSICVEKTLFQRAVGNLLSNAIKQTPATGQIRISAVPKGDWVEIAVQDTGVGIPPEHLPHVFERFYRVDASRSAGSGGSGLGLAIVKGIAQIHGGDVGIESRPGSGTRVLISLPA